MEIKKVLRVTCQDDQDKNLLCASGTILDEDCHLKNGTKCWKVLLTYIGGSSLDYAINHFMNRANKTTIIVPCEGRRYPFRIPCQLLKKHFISAFDQNSEWNYVNTTNVFEKTVTFQLYSRKVEIYFELFFDKPNSECVCQIHSMLSVYNNTWQRGRQVIFNCFYYKDMLKNTIDSTMLNRHSQKFKKMSIK